MESRSLLILAAVILLAAGVLKWLTDLQDGGNHLAASSNADAPSTLLQQVEQTTFNPAGFRHYRIEADQAIHYALREQAEFTRPLVYFYEDNQISWAARAHAGTANDNGDLVQLRGEVTVEQRDQSAHPLSVITEEIALHPRSQFAETTQPVTIRQANFTTTAVGLQVDMNAGTVILQSKVTSRYEPKPRP